MKRIVVTLAVASLLPLAVSCSNEVSAKPTAAQAETDAKFAKAAQIERGKKLVNFGGCHDCHTPLAMTPKGPAPDMTRALSGHPSNMIMPEPPKMDGAWLWAGAATNTAFAGPWGISYSRNLTPDQVSGLGIWTEEMFIKTMRTGRHMGVSRPILPPMPWQQLNTLPDEDLKAIFAYLRTVKPVRNEVPDAVVAAAPTPAS